MRILANLCEFFSKNAKRTAKLFSLSFAFFRINAYSPCEFGPLFSRLYLYLSNISRSPLSSIQVLFKVQETKSICIFAFASNYVSVSPKNRVSQISISSFPFSLSHIGSLRTPRFEKMTIFGILLFQKRLRKKLKLS
jgi:hypothetical protein